MENRFNITTETRPSATRSFLSGGISGAFSGAIMMGVLFGLSIIPGLPAVFPGLAIASVMVAATSLFSGIMAAKRAVFDTSTHTHHREQTVIPVPVGGITAPVISQSQEAALDSAEHAPTKNWVASTSRGGDSQSRVQQIIDKGMSDKARATAILAARDAASAEPSQRLM